MDKPKQQLIQVKDDCSWCKEVLLQHIPLSILGSIHVSSLLGCYHDIHQLLILENQGWCKGMGLVTCQMLC